MNHKPRSRRHPLALVAFPLAAAGTLTLLPAMLTAFGATVPFGEPSAWAQSASADADPMTTLARKRYADGVKAYEAGRFEEARAAFAQSYAIKHHPATLLNLGQSELRVGHPDEAGNHLQQFLREHAQATAEERAAAESSLAEATKKCGLLTIITDGAGADVSLDGTTLGKSPLPGPVFVKPGKHSVYANLAGKSATANVDAKAGQSASVPLAVQGGPTPPAPPPQGAGPKPASEATPPASTTPSAPASSPPASGAASQSFGSYFASKPMAWVGTGLAGAGLLVGILFGVSAQSASSSSYAQVAQMKADNLAHPQYNPTGTTHLCGDPSGKGAVAHYASACAALKQDNSNYQTDVALMATGWAVFGSAVVGTLAYTYASWSSAKGTNVSLAPILTPTERGIAVGASF